MSVKVLIVEGNAVARALLRRVVQESFSDIGDIVEAKNADEARAALQLTADLSAPAAAFQLILLDLELEDAQALQLLQRLARHPAKTVVTTLFADAEHLFPALQRGARGYLLKEDRFEVLVEELQKIVRGQPPLSPGIARQLQSYLLEGGAGQGILSTPERDVLVFGRETSGLPPDLARRFPDAFYALPMYHPGVRSQNLSNAVAAVVYDKLRQRYERPLASEAP